jgi:hypothetical protein
MDAKILEIMQKGPKRSIARVEVTDGAKTVIVPVVLKEGLDDDAFKAEAVAKAEARFAQAAAPAETPVVITPAEIPAAIQAVKDHFMAKIGEKIPLK